MATAVQERPDKLLRVEEAAQRLAVHPRYLYKMISEGRLAAVRVGSHGIRVAESDLLDYIDSNRELRAR